MKVIVYNTFQKLYNCKKLIGIFKNINGNNNKKYDGAILFIKNGKAHNEISYAHYHPQLSIKQFFYKNRSYTNITPKSWRKFVKNLKRQNNLKIFL